MLSPETKKIQNQLGTYCQTGNLIEIPGVNQKNLPHYRRLIFNVVNNNLRMAFPITLKAIGEEMFTELVSLFQANHKAQTPQIWKLPCEFCSYARKTNWSEKYHLPWLDDLLLLEWKEIEVHTMPDNNIPLSLNCETIEGKIVINPDFDIINLNYPVHLYSVNESLDKIGNYYILIYRQRNSGSVQFSNISILYVYIIELLQQNPADLSDIIKIVCSKLDMLSGELIEKPIKNFLKDMLARGFILGTV